MSVTLRTLDAKEKLSTLQEAIRQAEALAFRLLSITTGHVAGKPASLVALLQATAPGTSAPITLDILDGSLSQEAQEAQLNTGGKEIVCYGSLYVEGVARNVAAYRRP
jgi:hypothetical protein